MSIKFWRCCLAPLALLLLISAEVFSGGVIADKIVADKIVADNNKPCSPQQGMTFVCGPQNAEDLVSISETPWMIASGMSGEGHSGHLYLLDPAAQTYVELFPGPSPLFHWKKDEFPVCSGHLNTNNFSAHGLSIRALGGGLHRLYVTSHGAREAVEIFDINASSKEPRMAWVGCVEMPQHASINSVAALADGGFITTRIMGEGPQASGDIFAGDVTGYLYEWHPGGDITELTGTQMSGPNGIEISSDGKTVFVASWGRGEISRFRRGADGALNQDQTTEMNFRVDNLRWSKDATLYAVGHRLSENQDCGGPLCIDEWEVAELDPETMQARTLAVKKSINGFTGATVAIDADDGLWLGTFHGDRIVFLPKTTH